MNSRSGKIKKKKYLHPQFIADAIHNFYSNHWVEDFNISTYDFVTFNHRQLAINDYKMWSLPLHLFLFVSFTLVPSESHPENSSEVQQWLPTIHGIAWDDWNKTWHPWSELFYLASCSNVSQRYLCLILGFFFKRYSAQQREVFVLVNPKNKT